MPDKIEIHPADPAWPKAFAEEREKLERALARRGLLFEHVGSTAVPGLAAKSTIDLMIGSADGKVDDEAVYALEKLGYGFMGDHGVAERQLFRKGLPPTHHVHWTATGSAFWRDQLAFRDYLRSHPGEAIAYEELKRGMAAKYSHERERYTASKADFILAVLARAREHAKGCRRIVVDLEATCWEQGTAVDRQEIIEIGAVELDERLAARREFRCFVRPTREPRLSAFCLKLTGISQADVDGAQTVDDAVEKFAAWVGPSPFELCSWSDYDLRQLQVECARLGRPLPPGFERHVDLRLLYARARGAGVLTMKAALAHAGLKEEGAAHRALDDARQIAQLAQLLLRSSS